MGKNISDLERKTCHAETLPKQSGNVTKYLNIPHDIPDNTITSCKDSALPQLLQHS